jgi:adenylate cyclase class 2
VTGPIETEVKISFRAGAAEALRLLQERGYQVFSPRTLESDRVFDRPDLELRRSGRLLRLRSAAGQWTLTYKGPTLDNRYKSREEIETSASSGEALVQILEKLGYAPSWRYEKYRTGLRAMGESGTVFVDETPIGVFLELEGQEDWIDRTSLRLGFAPTDYITASYAALYREYLQTHDVPPDMIFPNPP